MEESGSDTDKECNDYVPQEVWDGEDVEYKPTKIYLYPNISTGLTYRGLRYVSYMFKVGQKSSFSSEKPAVNISGVKGLTTCLLILFSIQLTKLDYSCTAY